MTALSFHSSDLEEFECTVYWYLCKPEPGLGLHKASNSPKLPFMFAWGYGSIESMCDIFYFLIGNKINWNQEVRYAPWHWKLHLSAANTETNTGDIGWGGDPWNLLSFVVSCESL